MNHLSTRAKHLDANCANETEAPQAMLEAIGRAERDVECRLLIPWAPSTSDLAVEKRVILAANEALSRGWNASLDTVWLGTHYATKERRWCLRFECPGEDNRTEVLEAALTGLHALLYVPLGGHRIRLIGLEGVTLSRGRRLRPYHVAAKVGPATDMILSFLIPADASISIWAHLPPPDAAKQILALSFLANSRAAVYLDPRQLEDLVADGKSLKHTPDEAARLESAFQDAYKAVEAVIGTPARDDRKFAAQLLSAGLAPEIEAGAFTKRPLSKVVRSLTDTRDGRVAHGSSPRSPPISLVEVIEAQDCAEEILHCTLRALRGL